MDSLKAFWDVLREDWQALAVGLIAQVSLQSIPLLPLLIFEDKVLDKYREPAFICSFFWILLTVFIGTYVYDRMCDTFEHKRRQLR